MWWVGCRGASPVVRDVLLDSRGYWSGACVLALHTLYYSTVVVVVRLVISRLVTTAGLSRLPREPARWLTPD